MSELSSSESAGVKARLKSIPLITWLVRLLRLPSRFVELSSRFDRLESEQRAILASANKDVDEVRSQTASIARDLEMLHHALKERAGQLNIDTVKDIANREFSSETYLYFAFENKFRGDKADILKSQSQYVSYIKEAQRQAGSGPLLDVGCGRGEFLKLLRDNAVSAKGIDATKSMVDACLQQGLSAVHDDLLHFLKSVEDNSLLGITAFQVVEHLPVDYLIEFIKAARRKIAPGGILILETVNPDSLTSLKNFYTDLTHKNPIPSATLRFLVESVGFKSAEVRFTSDIPEASKLQGKDPNIQKLNQLLFGPQDYAVIGWK